DVSIAGLRVSVISALEDAQQGMLANMLDGGEWLLDGGELSIKVAASTVMIDMAFAPEPKKLVHAAASQAAGRPLKVRVVSGGGAVTVKMNGQKRLLSIKIEPDAAGDVEMLQDLVVAAVNEASRKVDEAVQASVGGMLGGMGMPI